MIFSLLIIMLFGALGAVSRFYMNELASKYIPGSFPTGTFLANISGSFAAGLITGLMISTGVDTGLMQYILTGYLGAYTTFSTWMVQSVGEIEAGDYGLLFKNLAGSVIAGLVAAVFGVWAGMLF